MKYGFFQEYLTKGRVLKNLIEKKKFYFVLKLVEADEMDFHLLKKNAITTIFFSSERFDQNGTAQGQCLCPTECEYDEYQARLSTGYFPAKNYQAVLNKLGMTNIR